MPFPSIWLPLPLSSTRRSLIGGFQISVSFHFNIPINLPHNHVNRFRPDSFEFEPLKKLSFFLGPDSTHVRLHLACISVSFHRHFVPTVESSPNFKFALNFSAFHFNFNFETLLFALLCFLSLSLLVSFSLRSSSSMFPRYYRWRWKLWGFDFSDLLAHEIFLRLS